MKKQFVFLFALLCGMQTMATNLVLQRTDGAQQLHDIALIGKLVFVERDLQLLDKQGNILATEPLDAIRGINFGTPSTPSSIESALQEGLIAVYPNPTHDVLIVQGIEDKQSMRVYDLQGRVVKESTTNEVNVSNLAEGTYLLQIGTQVVRFVKQ